MSSLFRLTILSVLFLFLVGCASSQMKARKDQRDKVAQSSKLFCEFINGDVYPDIDVALNLEMSKRCDSSKPYSMTNYRSPSEAVGIVYCCAMKEKEESSKKTEQKPMDIKPPEMKPPETNTKPNDAAGTGKPEPKKDDKK